MILPKDRVAGPRSNHRKGSIVRGETLVAFFGAKKVGWNIRSIQLHKDLFPRKPWCPGGLSGSFVPASRSLFPVGFEFVGEL
jgi:hypothetical protein